VVIQGDALEHDILEEAGIRNTEAVVAVTDDDETNILCSLLCKRYGVDRAITLVNTNSYGPLITTLHDRSTLLVSFDVPEVMVGELTADNDVSLTPWNRPETLTGEVVEVGSRIDPASRTFTARATVDNSADALRPGMSFRVTATAKGPTRRRQRDCRAVGRRRRLRVAHRVSSPNARRYASYSAGRGVRSSMRACSRATSSSSRESSACATGCRSSSISRRPRAGPRPPMRGRPRPAPTDGP